MNWWLLGGMILWILTSLALAFLVGGGVGIADEEASRRD